VEHYQPVREIMNISQERVLHGEGAMLYAPLLDRSLLSDAQIESLERGSLPVHVDRYMAPKLTWMDVLEDAWAIAGYKDFKAAMPRTQEMIELSEWVYNVLHAQLPLFFSIDVGCNFGTAKPSTEFLQFVATVDCVMKDREGRLHLVQMQAEGFAHLHAETDLVKLENVALAQAEDVATVSVLYLSDDQFVTRAITRKSTQATAGAPQRSVRSKSAPRTERPGLRN